MRKMIPTHGSESRQKTCQHHDRALYSRQYGAAQRSANHNRQPGNGGDQSLFEKTELAVPNQFGARKHSGEQNFHSNDSGGQELQILAFTRPLKNRTKTKPKGEKK